MASGLVPVVRIRTADGALDQYGEPIPGTEERAPLPPALFAPGSSSEPVQAGTNSVISGPTLYWRYQNPDVLASDLLIVDGVTWRVEGAPARWPKGTVVTLTAVTSPTKSGG